MGKNSDYIEVQHLSLDIIPSSNDFLFNFFLSLVWNSVYVLF